MTPTLDFQTLLARLWSPILLCTAKPETLNHADWNAVQIKNFALHCEFFNFTLEGFARITCCHKEDCSLLFGQR